MIKTESVYYRDKQRNKMYYTIFENKTYYSQREHSIDKFFVVDKEKKYEIFKKSCVAHNFTPFRFGKKIYGIGGMDDWKVDKKWRGITFDEFKAEFERHFNKPYKRGKEFYKQIKYKFDTTRIKSHCRGLYLFESDNGIDFSQKYDNPVLTVDSIDFNGSLEWKSSEFDTKICVCKVGIEYYIYIRNNIGKDRRYIQYTKTHDFINFEPFKNIDIDYNIETDNYYFAEVFFFNGFFWGFFPFYNNDISCIRFAKSKDGHKWDIVHNLFLSIPFTIENGKRKNRDHICGGIIEKKNDFFFYVNHNFLGYDNECDVNVMSYSISKKYLRSI